MSWFNPKSSQTPGAKEVEKRAIVEIEAHKDAQHEAVVKAKQASENLNSLLVENGFTLKIYLATGGHIKTTKKKGQ